MTSKLLYIDKHLPYISIMYQLTDYFIIWCIIASEQSKYSSEASSSVNTKLS